LLKQLALSTAFRLYQTARAIDPRNRKWNAPYRALAPDGLPLPSADLVFQVAGTARIEHYIDGGEKAACAIRQTLAKHGASVESLGNVLDFGCGCGRVARQWKSLPKTKIFGTDCNPTLVRWCTDKLPFASFNVNSLRPPLGYSDSTFDLVYALSVFTHLPEEMQSAWLMEIRRVLRPGGWLIISTHGKSYLSKLDRAERRRFLEGELVVRFGSVAGSNLCATFHPEQYVRETLARGWELMEFEPEGAKGNPYQDLILLRKPADSLFLGRL
jgi:SAM-dependent methyltransferase